MEDKNVNDEQIKKTEELIKDKLEQQEVTVDKSTGKFIHKG